jgi:hypothetical protein
LPNFGLLGGVLGIILVPVFAFLYGAMGSVFATIIGGIINLVMKGAGGLKLEVNLDQPVVAGHAVVNPAVGPAGPTQVPPSDPTVPEPPGTQG